LTRARGALVDVICASCAGEAVVTAGVRVVADLDIAVSAEMRGVANAVVAANRVHTGAPFSARSGRAFVNIDFAIITSPAGSAIAAVRIIAVEALATVLARQRQALVFAHARGAVLSAVSGCAVAVVTTTNVLGTSATIGAGIGAALIKVDVAIEATEAVRAG